MDRLGGTVEWVIYDKEKARHKIVKARNQEKAVKKAVNLYGYIPQKVDHATPRRGWHIETMPQKKFQELVAGLV